MYDAGITFNNSSWDDMVAGMGADKFACIADAVWMVGSIKDAVPDQDGKWAVMLCSGCTFSQQKLRGCKGIC